MQNAARRSNVRIPERACSLPEDWLPEIFDPAQKARDNMAVSRIQGYNHGDLFGQVVSVPGVTLNGQPVNLLICGSRGQARDLLDHHEMVVRVEHLERPDDESPVDLEDIIEFQLAHRSLEVD